MTHKCRLMIADPTQPGANVVRMVGSLPVVAHTTQLAKSLAFGAIVAGSISMGAMAQSASGQIGGGITCAMAARNELSPDDHQQIENFVAAARIGLTDTDPLVAKQARDTLLAPLKCNRVTVGFRLGYGAAMWNQFRSLIGPEVEPRVVANVLRLMGRSRSSEAVRALSQGIQDQRPVVRFGATVGYRELLSKPSSEVWPINRGQRTRTLDNLKQALTNESNAMVVNGIVLAMTSVQDAELRIDAMTRLSRGLSVRRASIPIGNANSNEVNNWISAYSRCLVEVRRVLLAQNTADRELALAASILGGQSLAFVRDLIEHPKVVESESLQDQLGDIVSAAEAAVSFAAPALGQVVTPPNLIRSFNGGNRAAFEKAIDHWIGDGGLLTKQPYNEPAASFN